MIDETNQSASGSNAPGGGDAGSSGRVGYCQDCGRPLTRETVRPVGSAVFCEPCLEVRLAAAGGFAAAPPPGAGAVPPVTGSVEPFPPLGGHTPSPALAAVLGLIPGVGAMYNGQFAKGIAHIIIFALLNMMADHNGFFGALVVGWVFYQSFEAYHTAKARLAGLPLPDPFGLNNIGQHIGFTAHFRATSGPRASAPDVQPPAPGNPYPGWTGYVPQPIVTPPPMDPVPPAQSWGSVPVTAYETQAAAPSPAWATPPEVVQEPAAPVRVNRFPAAAVWLIGLGLVFFVMNIEPNWNLSVSKLVPFVLMMLGVWIFARRMSSTGGLAPAEGEGEAYTTRAVLSLRAPVILFTIGVLTSLQAFEIIRLGKTWPVLVIVLGALLLLERAMGARAFAARAASFGTVPGVDEAQVRVDGVDGKGL